MELDVNVKAVVADRQRSNAAPGRYRIEIPAIGSAPYVIRPASALPPIKGPVTIEGSAWQSTGELIAIDGSDYIESKGMETCPGALAGQYGANIRTTALPGLALVDTQGVDIGGLEIRNFCIGILIHRASGNVVHDNRIIGNRGGAGVMLTGDDGSGNPTAGITVHNKVLRNVFVDNGDGLEALIVCGVRRVLTSGGATTALEGIESLATLVLRAAGRIHVMAGGGIREKAVRDVVTRSGVGEIHVRGTKVVGVDRTACRHIRLRSPLPTDESSWEETDEERIRAIVALAGERNPSQA